MKGITRVCKQAPGPAELVARFRKKSDEFGTVERVYCSRRTCSAFLGAATASPTALRCVACGTETCGHCKEAAHPPTRKCVRTAHQDVAVLALGRAEGWQRCPACGHLVELNHGCYHITCLCKKEFCYLCAAAWKQCECPRFADVPDPDEEDDDGPPRLDDIDAVEMPPPPPPRLPRLALGRPLPEPPRREDPVRVRRLGLL